MRNARTRLGTWLNALLAALVGQAGPVAIFLCATIPNLHLPGIQYDEVYYVPPAAALLKNQPEADYVMLDPSVVRIFGWKLPLMFNYYTSFLRTYLTLPLFAAFGISVGTIRGSSIALGAIALMFSVAFARRLSRSRFVALASGTLLALDASFVAYAHNDFAVVGTMMALKGAALWALLRWWQEGEALAQPRRALGDGQVNFLYLGAFAIGLGVSDRASFLWIPMALAVTMCVLYGRRLPAEIRQRLGPGPLAPWPGRQDGAVWPGQAERPGMAQPGRARAHWLARAGLAVVAFSLGAAVFLAFNVATLGGTFTPMLSSFGMTAGGVDNSAVLSNLYLRLQMLTDVLAGSYLNHFIMGEASYQTSAWHFGGSPLSWLVLVSFVYYLVRVAASRMRSRLVERPAASKGRPRAAAFLVSMTTVLLLLSCFTPTLHRGHQLLMLYPFVHIMVAMFLFDVARYVRGIWPAGLASPSPNVLGGGLLLLLSAAASRPVFGYHQLLQQTGGRGAWSDAIYDIVAEVDRHPERVVVCMDWGFNANILSLTKNPVRTIRNYYLHTRRHPAQLAQLFDSTHVFLFHAPSHTVMPVREDFSAALALADAKVETLRTFYQRDGQPLAFLVQARPQPRRTLGQGRR